jgi:GTPase SAR1 family protein
MNSTNLEQTIHTRKLEALKEKLVDNAKAEEQKALRFRLVGPAKIGKTTFLKQLVEDLNKEKLRAIFIYVDCKSQFWGWKTVLTALWDEAIKREDVPGSIIGDLHDLLYRARKGEETLDEHSVGRFLQEKMSSWKVYIFLDHFDTIIKNGVIERKYSDFVEYFESFTAMLRDPKVNNLGVVVVTREPIPAHLAGPFGGEERLTLPTQEEALKFIKAIYPGTEAEQLKILREVGYHPYYIKIYCAVRKGIVRAREWDQKFQEHFQMVWEEITQRPELEAWVRKLVAERKNEPDQAIELAKCDKFTEGILYTLHYQGIVAMDEKETKAWLPGQVIARFVTCQTWLEWLRYDDTTMFRVLIVNLAIFLLIFALNEEFIGMNRTLTLLTWVISVAYPFLSFLRSLACRFLRR